MVTAMAMATATAMVTPVVAMLGRLAVLARGRSSMKALRPPQSLRSRPAPLSPPQ